MPVLYKTQTLIIASLTITYHVDYYNITQPFINIIIIKHYEFLFNTSSKCMSTVFSVMGNHLERILYYINKFALLKFKSGIIISPSQNKDLKIILCFRNLGNNRKEFLNLFDKKKL